MRALLLEARQAPVLFGQGGHEFAAEVGDAWDHAAPDQVALAERRLVHPGRACVLRLSRETPISVLVWCEVPEETEVGHRLARLSTAAGHGFNGLLGESWIVLVERLGPIK